MIDSGWLQKVGPSHYRPTAKVFRIGAATIANLDLRDEARPILRRLAVELGDTTYLMVPEPEGALCIEKVEGKYPVQVNYPDIGMTMPFHIGAGAHAILAYHPEYLDTAVRQAADVEAFTNATPRAKTQIVAKIESVRKNGYALAIREVSPDVGAVGAPIFGADSRVVGAVSVGATMDRLHEVRLEMVITAVKAASNEISKVLGYHEDGETKDALWHTR